MSERDTTVLDQLYLEWSQFTSARTNRELSLCDALETLAEAFRDLAPSDPNTEEGWAYEEHLNVWLAAKAALDKASLLP